MWTEKFALEVYGAFFSFHKGCYAGLPCFCLGGAVPNCRKQRRKIHFGECECHGCSVALYWPDQDAARIVQTPNTPVRTAGMNRRRSEGHCCYLVFSVDVRRQTHIRLLRLPCRSLLFNQIEDIHPVSAGQSVTSLYNIH
jgi:hypothetical protein